MSTARHLMRGFIGMLLLLSTPIEGQSVFGHPWGGARGIDDFYGQRYGRQHPSALSHGFGNWHDDDYDDYFRQPAPCPRYQPMHLSDWQVASDQQITLDVSLPHVRHQDMRVSLSDDYSTIHLKARRALPERGRTCLPAGARVSHDDRYEILEADIPVPGVADGAKASMRELQGGIRLLLPRRPPSRDASGLYQGRSRADKLGSARGASVGGGVGAKTQGKQTEAKVAGDAAVRYAQASRQLERSPVQVKLPPSTGILVEEADFPWPDKNADASEGWLDNRGEFQYY